DHEDRAIGAEGPHRLEHVSHERPTAELVQDLRVGRLHPRALTGGEDHDGERPVCGAARGAHGATFQVAFSIFSSAAFSCVWTSAGIRSASFGLMTKLTTPLARPSLMRRPWKRPVATS